MKARFLLAETVAVLSLITLAFASQPPGARATTGTQRDSLDGSISDLPPCEQIEASPLAWATADEEGHITGQVKSYPADTYYLLAVYEVNCMPANTTLSVVWTKGSGTLYTRKYSPKPLLGRGQMEEFVGIPDQTPLGEGKYGLKIYRLDGKNKELLTSGDVLVGDDTPQKAEVTVTGLIQDRDTRKPIAGVMIYVAKPGVDVDDYYDNKMPKGDTFASATTDSRGKFTIKKALSRSTQYGWVITAKGYIPIIDTVSIDELGSPALNIALKKAGE
ncbi:MAG: hypothetical protein M1546_27375 [Chloroflexi bacterium]|nr:hypothetical protein [Chloroflexota bacterium]